MLLIYSKPKRSSFQTVYDVCHDGHSPLFFSPFFFFSFGSVMSTLPSSHSNHRRRRSRSRKKLKRPPPSQKPAPSAAASHLRLAVCVSARKVRHSCAEELQKSLFTTRSPSDEILTRDINPVGAFQETTFFVQIKHKNKPNHCEHFFFFF